MFKLSITHKNTYSEVAQPNPLRWRIMYRDKNVLSSQSSLIKCKDFFNDLVAWKHGKRKFAIYGFKNDLKFNRYGIYFVLTKISNRDKFFANLDVLNQRLQQDLGTRVSYYKTLRGKDRAIIHIPNPLWQSTYHISLVSMLIRLCNYNYSYEKWEDFYNPDAPMNTADGAFNDKAKAFTKEHGFVLPEAYQKYWYFARYGFNSEKQPNASASVIHNNGCSDWAMAISEVK
jgi:hypothetical protein